MNTDNDTEEIRWGWFYQFLDTTGTGAETEFQLNATA